MIRKAEKIVAPFSGGRVSYRVPYADTDQMGVVYYANYLVLFERCRNELMRETGLTYAEFESRGLGLPVVEAHVSYRMPIFYDDLVEISGKVTFARGCRIRIDCVVARDGEVLAHGYTVHGCMDMRNRRPARLPPELVEDAES